MESIEKLAKKYSALRQILSDRVYRLRADHQAITRRLLPGIKAALSAAQDAKIELEAEIIEKKSLFKRPKTRVFHGIKCGFKKEKGKIQFDNGEQVIRLIRKHCQDQADVLIKQSESPIRAALAALDAATLKKIGVVITDSGDRVISAPTDSDVDKLVSALLENKRDMEGE